MSESTGETLVRRVTLGVRAASTIPTPIDPTLSIQGEAADAKATGDAIAGVIGNLRVNGKAASNNAITVLAGDIPMSSAAGAASIADTIENLQNKTASGIMYDSENNVSIKAALDDIYSTLETDLSEADIDDLFDEVFGEDDE